MSTYANQTTPLNPQKRLTTRATELVAKTACACNAPGRFLASINLSQSSTWDYQLKQFPRPKGKATQVVYTEYDLPRPTIEPHDVIVDPDGMAWYSNLAGKRSAKSIRRPANIPNSRCPN